MCVREELTQQSKKKGGYKKSLNNLVHRSRTVNLIAVIIPDISDKCWLNVKSEKRVIINLTDMELQMIEWVAYSQDTQEKVLIKPEDCKDLDDREFYRLIKGYGI